MTLLVVAYEACGAIGKGGGEVAIVAGADGIEGTDLRVGIPLAGNAVPSFHFDRFAQNDGCAVAAPHSAGAKGVIHTINKRDIDLAGPLHLMSCHGNGGVGGAAGG